MVFHFFSSYEGTPFSGTPAQDAFTQVTTGGNFPELVGKDGAVGDAAAGDAAALTIVIDATKQELLESLAVANGTMHPGGVSALHAAATAGYTKTAAKCLEIAGMELFILKDAEGQTALDYAKIGGKNGPFEIVPRPEMVHLLEGFELGFAAAKAC